MPGPLHGVRVVEIGVWVAGPAAGGVLADWGADVVKIEPPGIGDPARTFQRMLGADLPFNPIFENDNRSKRSIVLDSRQARGARVALELIADADVFLSNVRPAALARLGLDPKSLLERDPRLVYGVITGYGTEGPDADKAAYDIAGFWARSGVAGLLTAPGSHPPFQRGGMGDHTAGQSLAGGIAAGALPARAQRQGPARDDVAAAPGPVHDQLRSRGGRALRCLGRRRQPQDDGQSVHQQLSGPRTASGSGSSGSRASDTGRRSRARRVIPSGSTIRASRRPRRARPNAGVLIAELDRIFATRSRDDWGKVFDAEADLWWAPVQTIDEVLADPRCTRAADSSTCPMATPPPSCPRRRSTSAERRGQPRSDGARTWQHTDEILAELGRTPAQIAALRAQGAAA
jgi:crotonobetainyl-CoA:carnitine CoA-transferase CaiB-like acyl-CoA transferase